MLTKQINEKNVPFYENTFGILGVDADGNVKSRLTVPEQKMEGIEKLVLFVTSGTEVYPLELNLSDILSAQYLAEKESV